MKRESETVVADTKSGLENRAFQGTRQMLTCDIQKPTKELNPNRCMK